MVNFIFFNPISKAAIIFTVGCLLTISHSILTWPGGGEGGGGFCLTWREGVWWGRGSALGGLHGEGEVCMKGTAKRGVLHGGGICLGEGSAWMGVLPSHDIVGRQPPQKADSLHTPVCILRMRAVNIMGPAISFDCSIPTVYSTRCFVYTYHQRHFL